MNVEQSKTEHIQIENDQISLKELILKMQIWIFYLKSKWKIIFIGGIIGIIIGLFIAWLDKQYIKQC